MSGRRYDRILSSTALALILVAPLGAGAQDASKQNGKIAATFSERYSPEQTPAPSFSSDHDAGGERPTGLRCECAGRYRPVRAAIRSTRFA